MDNAAKEVLIVWLKIPQMPSNLFAQFVCPSPKVLDFNKKRLYWASVVSPSAPPLHFDGPTYSKASEQALIYAYLFNSRITVFTKDTYKYT